MFVCDPILGLSLEYIADWVAAVPDLSLKIFAELLDPAAPPENILTVNPLMSQGVEVGVVVCEGVGWLGVVVWDGVCDGVVV